MRLCGTLLLCCAASIATAAEDAAALQRAMREGKPRLAGTLLGHESPVRRVAISQERTHIVSAGDDGMVRVWDARSGAPIYALPETDGRALFQYGRKGGTSARSMWKRT